ncbi:MAG TPA: F0F1 ATP synthase subunit beta, partial [Proteobacteria bacterium]|nr:F0F1 ATP synthase subunit beta [Pseudomonadota bacterium]
MTTPNTTGSITQIIGAVVDVRFPEGALPPLLNALRIDDEAKHIHVVLEVETHLGEDTVRCVAMSSTDGLVRGMAVVDTGSAITVPVGEGALGRIVNVVGEPVDQLGPVKCDTRWPIHRQAPLFADQETSTEIFETGIKV